MHYATLAALLNSSGAFIVLLEATAKESEYIHFHKYFCSRVTDAKRDTGKTIVKRGWEKFTLFLPFLLSLAASPKGRPSHL